MEVEGRLKIRSTWNIPSDRYPLNAASLTNLAKNGEVGAHDTKHDGRLVFLSVRELTLRLASCRAEIESRADQKIQGFRAPLLQHSLGLAEALSHSRSEGRRVGKEWRPR